MIDLRYENTSTFGAIAYMRFNAHSLQLGFRSRKRYMVEPPLPVYR
jgi:hypothetical protein